MTPHILLPRLLAASAIALSAVWAWPGPSDAHVVRMTERRWLDAEFHGDTATLRQLLAPEYRSVSWKGVKNRDAILATALRHAANRDSEPPYADPQIEIHGETAIATFTVPDTSYSADVFTFDDGSWHPIYSQHTYVGTEQPR